MRLIDFTKEAVGLSLQELSRAVEKGHCGHHSFIESPGVGTYSMTNNNNFFPIALTLISIFPRCLLSLNLSFLLQEFDVRV